jgi:hypothetical protein
MNRCNNLIVIDHYADKKFSILRRRIQDTMHNRHLAPFWKTNAQLADIVINLQNLWSSLCKWYFVSCALGCRSKTGAKISSAVPGKTAAAALNYAITHAGKPWRQKKTNVNNLLFSEDEPAWHVPRYFLNVCVKSNLSNLANVSAALSSGTTVFDHLLLFRNYCAHRSRQTRAKAMAVAPSYLVAVGAEPFEVLIATDPKTKNIVLNQWLIDLEATFDSLTN